MDIEQPADNPGKYDDLSEFVLLHAHAVAALVIVLEGDKGNGFSVSTIDPDVLPTLPALLESVAVQIRAQHKKKAN